VPGPAHAGDPQPSQEEHGPDPQRERLYVEAEHGQPVRTLIKVHPCHCHHNDDQREPDADLAKHHERALGPRSPEIGERAHPQDDRQRDDGHRHQLEETRPSVQGVGHARRLDHTAATLGERHDLRRGEGTEQDRDGPEDDPDLNRSEAPREAPQRGRRVNRSSAKEPRHEEESEQSGTRVPDESWPIEVDADDRSEHCVGRSQQCRQDRHHGDGQQHASDHLPPPTA
jgi:hypothetical protein